MRAFYRDRAWHPPRPKERGFPRILVKLRSSERDSKYKKRRFSNCLVEEKTNEV